MTRRRQPRNPRCQTCGKIRFTEIAAKLAIAGQAGDKGAVRAYPCPAGRGWHITSKR